MKIKNKIIGVITSIVLINCGMSVLATGFDINADNKIDVNDVTYLQNALSDFAEDTKLDLNSDGRIDVNDVSFLQIEISKQSVENNTQISISTKEYCKNVGDTFTISVDTTEKRLAKVKVNKVGNATVTIKQCNKIITTKVKVEKAKCIDISEWNGDINFNKVRNTGVTCVIIRAGYGKDPNQEDNKFQEYYRQAKSAGLNVGAYWYSYATSVDAAKAEVKNCMKTIGDKEFDLPVFLDVEEYRQAVLPRRTLTDIISTFCDGIKSNGFESGLYSAKSMLVDSAYPDELASKYLIWMAAPNNSYNELPAFVDIHQYSWNGKVDGIRGDVDLNYIYNLN